MTYLSIAVLGSPLVCYEEQEIRFSTRKQLALLLYLAVEGGMHSRQSLSELFWPELDAEHARSALRTTLRRLREQLADASHGHEYLLSDRTTLGLAPDAKIRLDVHSMEEAWDATRNMTDSAPSLSTQRQQELVNGLEHALRLVRGSFLAGFSLQDAIGFDNWSRFQSEHWHVRATTLFAHLARLQEAASEREQALHTVTRWLEIDPLNENAYQCLMRLHLSGGNKRAALQSYDAYRKMLFQELQAQPTAEIMELAHHIRSVTALAEHVKLTLHPSASATSLFESPLIGRRAEFGTLLEQYYSITDGIAQAVLVEGEAGIGKTRLVMEFIGWAQAQGADVLHGQAFEAGGRLSYQVVVDALRPRLEREHTPETLVSSVWLAELARLFPKLQERYPDLSIPLVDESAARTRLFEAVARLLHALARRAPLIFVLDDIQWADTASLDLLLNLAHYMVEKPSPFLFIACLRSEALLSGSSGLMQWRMGLERLIPLRRLSLASFSPQETLDLLSSVLDDGQHSMDDSLPNTELDSRVKLGTWLYTQTTGQPFYLFEMLKLLRERGVLLSKQGGNGHRYFMLAHNNNEVLIGATSVPLGVYELIAYRLEQLSSATFALLTASAILGQQCSFEVLTRVAALSEHEGLLALEEGLRSSMFYEEQSHDIHRKERCYILQHDLIREVVIRHCSDARKHRLHQRAFQVLEEGHSASSAELAHHAFEAGLIEAALRYSVAAGDEAMLVFATQDAIAHFEHVRRLLSEVSVMPTMQQSFPHVFVKHLYLHLARAYELAQQWQQARLVYMELLNMAQQEQREHLEVTLLNHLAMLTMRYEYDVSATLHLLETALQKAQTSGGLAGQIETEINLAMLIGRGQQDFLSARPYAEHAVALARSLGQPDLLSYSLYALTIMYNGRWPETMMYGMEAYDLFQQVSTIPQEYLDALSTPLLFTGVSPSVELGIQALAIDCLMYVVLAMTFRGEHDALQKALPLAQQNHEHALQSRNENIVFSTTFALFHVHLEMGHYEECLSLTQSALALAQRIRTSHARFWALYMQSIVELRLFHLDGVQHVSAEMKRLAEEQFNPYYVEIALACQIATEVLQANWYQAHMFAIQAVQVRASNKNVQRDLDDLLRLFEVEALLHGGDEVLAQASVDNLSSISEETSCSRISLLRSQALIARWKKETAKAIALLEEACLLADEIGLPGELWQIQAMLGELYLTRADERRAKQAYTQAVHILQKLTDEISDQQVRRNFLSAPQVQSVFELLQQIMLVDECI